MEHPPRRCDSGAATPVECRSPLTARLALVRKLRRSTEILFSQHKKFSADSQFVSTAIIDETQ